MLILRFSTIVKRASAPKKLGTPSAACDSSRVQSNFLLCDADGNSASVCRKWPCLEPHAGALNQRSSDATNICRIASRNLNRRRNRTFGISKKIPDISARLCLRWQLIASGIDLLSKALNFLWMFGLERGALAGDPVVSQRVRP